MILKLFSIIVCLIAAAFFIGFNLDNKCDVNVIFYTFKQTSVFFTIIFSFAAGILFTLPFAFMHRLSGKKKKQAHEEKPQSVQHGVPIVRSASDSENDFSETEGERDKSNFEET